MKHISLQATYFSTVFSKTIIDESLNGPSKLPNVKLGLNPGLPLHNSLLRVLRILVVLHFFCDALDWKKKQILCKYIYTNI